MFSLDLGAFLLLAGRLGDSPEFPEIIIRESEILKHLVTLDDRLLHPNPPDMKGLLPLFFIHKL
jgi:hypothetical protein